MSMRALLIARRDPRSPPVSPSRRTTGAGSSPGSTLVELRPAARCAEAVFVTADGGTLLAPSLGLYRVPNTRRGRGRGLPFAHVVPCASAPRTGLAGSLAVEDFADPLVPTEWWRAAVGVDTLTPPPVGRPVTIVDSGIDVSHPEFLGRANTETLNAQEPVGIGGEHGTSVASLVAAPANGLGLVGIYPEALLALVGRGEGAGHRARDDRRSCKASLQQPTTGPASSTSVSAPTARSFAIEQAIYEAVRKGTLIVAASGNDGDTGSPLGYPASIPHVLTVGASDRSERDRRTSRVAHASSISPRRASTSRSRRRSGRVGATGDGTSFATPLVSGPAAWVWTARPELDATQLFEVMRRSATDIGVAGQGRRGRLRTC